MQAMLGMLTGIIIAFIYSWHIALVAVGLAPLMMIGGAYNAKMQ